MPIKWKPFNMPLPKKNNVFPFDDLEPEGGEGWNPFMPKLRSDEPAVDIYQDKQNLYVEVSLSGVKPEDVKVSVEDNVLTVIGRTEEKVKEAEKTKDQEEKDYFRREITRVNSFRRVLKLPVDVKEAQAKAETLGGILKITLPKVARSSKKAKDIPIKIK